MNKLPFILSFFTAVTWIVTIIVGLLTGTTPNCSEDCMEVRTNNLKYCVKAACSNIIYSNNTTDCISWDEYGIQDINGSLRWCNSRFSRCKSSKELKPDSLKLALFLCNYIFGSIRLIPLFIPMTMCHSVEALDQKIITFHNIKTTTSLGYLIVGVISIFTTRECYVSEFYCLTPDNCYYNLLMLLFMWISMMPMLLYLRRDCHLYCKSTIGDKDEIVTASNNIILIYK